MQENYTVTFSGNNNSEVSRSFIIAKAESSAEDFDFSVPDGLVYDGSEKSATVKPKSGINKMGAVTLKYYNENGENVSPVDAGTYKVKIEVAEGENYLASNGEFTKEEWTFTIDKASLPENCIESKMLVYTGAEQELVSSNSTVLPTGCTVEYRVNDETQWSSQIPKATAADTYEVYYRISGNDNYEIKEGSVTAVITKDSNSLLEISREYTVASDSEDTVNLSELLPTDCGTVSYNEPVTTGDITYTNEPAVTDGILSYTVATGAADTTGTITLVAQTQNYENITIVVNIKLTEQNQTGNPDKPGSTDKSDKSEALITIEEGRQAYTKILSADDFRLEGITYKGDGRLTYTVADGMTLTGEAAAPESIITVSENGVVSIHGTGSAKIYVGSTETDKYTAAQPQVIQVNVALGDEFYVEGVKSYGYTGKAVKPDLSVFDGLNGNLLTNKKDYTVTYKNNKNAYTLKEGDAGFDAKKAPQAIIKGKGRYSSSLTVYFTIQPKDISQDYGIAIKDILLEENGNVQKKVPAITYNGKKLAGVLKPENGSLPAKTKDFVYSYPQSEEGAYTKANTWKILVEGTGNYTGSRYVDVVIAAKGGKMSSAKIAKIADQNYNGVPVELSKEALVVTAKVNGVKTTLEQGVHYNVSYKNNNAVGTATVTITGIPENGFSGSKSATFKIVGTSIQNATVTGITAKNYDGNVQTQDVTVTLAGSSEPLAKENYTVSYVNNVNAGTAKVIITGVGTYSGTIVKTFKINPYDITAETNSAGAVKENSPLTEANGLFAMKDGDLCVKFVKGGAKPSVRLVFNGQALTEGRDYKVAYKNNKKVYTSKEGDADYNSKKAPVITVTGKGNFKGKVSKAFVITARTLQEEGMAVSMTASDKAVSNKKGKYISKPVLTDADGKVLKQGKDYTAPVYTITNEKGEVITLSKTDTIEKAGTVVTVTVKGLGTYAGTAENESVLSTSYRVAANDFTKAKATTITKTYTGSAITLTEDDFYSTNALGKKVSIVTMGSGTKAVQLHYGTDFEVVEGTYKKNIEKGTASVTIRGIGAYGGRKTIKFKIGTRTLDDWFWWMDMILTK